jgi:POT family proton-dependent oligopeptide transporter
MARHRCARRGDDHHDLPVDRLLPARQRCRCLNNAALRGWLSIPVPWYQSVDPLFSIVGVPLLFWIWRRQASRRGEPGDINKIGIGAWLAAASNLILVFAILTAGPAPVHPVWPFLYCAGQGIAFLYYWPTLLALVSRAAPAKVNATMMGLAFMSRSANNLIGWIGGFMKR